MFGKQVSSPVILDFVALALIVVGLIFGIIALFGISRHGSKGILAPAVIGIIINGLLVFIFVTNFMAARARAQQQTGIEASPVVAVWSNNSPAPTAALSHHGWKPTAHGVLCIGILLSQFRLAPEQMLARLQK